MNITVNSQVLAQELKLLNKVIVPKSALPALSSVLVRADAGRLTLSATDLELALTTSCEAQVTTPGSVLLPIKHVVALIDQVANTDITLTADHTVVRLKANTFNSRLQTTPVAEFPPIPAMYGEALELNSRNLDRLIENVRYAISESALKYILNGALLSLAGNVMALVATDGKRLSIASAAQPTDGQTLQVVIPAKTLDAVAILCQETQDNVAFTHSENHFFFQFGERVLMSRRLVGEFPKYQSIIPKDNDKQMVVDRLAFEAVLKRVGLAADESGSVTFSLSHQGLLRISARNLQLGDADETLPVGYTGDDLTVAVNYQHVLDFLSEATSQRITVTMKQADRPLMFTDGTEFLNVIMGMRV